jgi:N-acetylneuraminate synthase
MESSRTLPKSFALGNIEVGPSRPCFVLAEIALAHDGSLGTAHAYIDAVARTGAHGIKFQTHIAEAESTLREPFRVRFSPQDATRYDYWKRTAFDREQWAGLASHAREKGLVFLSSPFSEEAVDLLDAIGTPAFKIGSGETLNLPLLAKAAKPGKPIILSTGLSTWTEIDTAVEVVAAGGAPVAILQCTSAYPCPPEKVGLDVITQLSQRYGCPVGLSDHSGTIYAGLAAAAMRADIIEVHVVFSQDCFGPDVAASLTIEELKMLVEGCEFIHRAHHGEVRKDEVSSDVAAMRTIFSRSVVAKMRFEMGHVITSSDLALKKPGGGTSPAQMHSLVGRVLTRSIEKDEWITDADVK